MNPTICGRCAAANLRPSQRQFSTKSWTFDSEIRRQTHSAFRARHDFYQKNNHTLRRYASSSSSSSSSTKSLKPKTEPRPSSILADVNPPASTRPPPLERPPKLPNNSSIWQRVPWLISTGRAFFQFYKAGMKSVYENYKIARGLRVAFGLPQHILSSKMPPGKGITSAAFIAQMDNLQQSRADFQLVRRSAHDTRRMLPFGLVLLICGEFTPLVVAMIGNAVTPVTCRLPNQNRKTRQKQLELKRQALRDTQADLGSATPIRTGSDEEMEWLAKSFGSREFATGASDVLALRGCAVFGLVKSLNRPLSLVSSVYRPRLVRWAEYLEVDDKLLLRGGGVKALIPEEVCLAVEERGGLVVDDLELDPAERDARNREWLTRWLAARKGILGSV